MDSRRADFLFPFPVEALFCMAWMAMSRNICWQSVLMPYKKEIAFGEQGQAMQDGKFGLSEFNPDQEKESRHGLFRLGCVPGNGDDGPSPGCCLACRPEAEGGREGGRPVRTGTWRKCAPSGPDPGEGPQAPGGERKTRRPQGGSVLTLRAISRGPCFSSNPSSVSLRGVLSVSGRPGRCPGAGIHGLAEAPGHRPGRRDRPRAFPRAAVAAAFAFRRLLSAVACFRSSGACRALASASWPWRASLPRPPVRAA